MSSVLSQVLKPVNRHLTIVPHLHQKEQSSTVLLPEDYEQEEDRYIVATVLDVAADCSKELRALRTDPAGQLIVVDRSMVSEISIKGKSYYTILENYVVGILRDFNEM
tara:strand:+ start:1028 stop:1351 length:324 start_codon:yes stop_codon:yes gene_type:complete